MVLSLLMPKERKEGGTGHWETRVWETSEVEIWVTYRDLGFPVTEDKDLLRSERDTGEKDALEGPHTVHQNDVVVYRLV
jgi:hypothetical protein